MLQNANHYPESLTADRRVAGHHEKSPEELVMAPVSSIKFNVVDYQW